MDDVAEQLVQVGHQISDAAALHRLGSGTVIRDGDHLVGEIGRDNAGRPTVLWVGEPGEYSLSEVVCSAEHPVTVLATVVQ